MCFNGNIPFGNEEEFKLQAAVESNPLPELPLLESLDIVKAVGIPDAIEKVIMAKYGRQLRKLSTSMHWRNWGETPLDNLADLQVTLRTETFDMAIESLRNVLGRLANPNQLVKLSIVFCLSRDQIVILQDLLKVLEPCKNIESLHIMVQKNDKIRPSKIIDFNLDLSKVNGNPMLPSVKYLSISDTPGLRYQFLKSFPSLEHLNVEIPVIGFDNRMGRKSIIAEEIQKHAESLEYLPDNVIWRMLPSSVKVFTTVIRKSEDELTNRKYFKRTKVFNSIDEKTIECLEHILLLGVGNSRGNEGGEIEMMTFEEEKARINEEISFAANIAGVIWSKIMDLFNKVESLKSQQKLEFRIFSQMNGTEDQMEIINKDTLLRYSWMDAERKFVSELLHNFKVKIGRSADILKGYFVEAKRQLTVVFQGLAKIKDAKCLQDLAGIEVPNFEWLEKLPDHEVESLIKEWATIKLRQKQYPIFYEHNSLMNPYKLNPSRDID